MASSVVILVLKGRSFDPILEQLGVRDLIRWVSSSTGFGLERLVGVVAAKQSLTSTPLLSAGSDGTALRWTPHCRSGAEIAWRTSMSFDEWWAEPVFEASDGGRLARGDLVRTMRDQDGGAHLDRGISSLGYMELALDAAPGLKFDGRPLRDAHRATMRQIAWEVLESVEALEI